MLSMTSRVLGLDLRLSDYAVLEATKCGLSGKLWALVMGNLAL